MLSRVPRVYWDASVFLAYLEGRETLVCDALFASARKGDIELLTSVVSLSRLQHLRAQDAAALTAVRRTEGRAAAVTRSAQQTQNDVVG
jgi:hypothetical protein